MARNTTDRKNKEVAPRHYPKTYEVLTLAEEPNDESRALPYLSFTCQSAMDHCEAAELSLIGRLGEGAVTGNAASLVLRVREESNGPPLYERGPWVYVEVTWTCRGRRLESSEVAEVAIP